MDEQHESAAETTPEASHEPEAPQPAAPTPPVPPQPQVQHQPMTQVSSAPSPYTKTPGLAAFLSAVPGLGNIYNGLYLRGIAFFLTYVSLFALAVQTAESREAESEMAFLVPSIFFFWCFNIFDAYRQAMLINYAETYKDPEAGKGQLPTSGGLAAGGIVFLVGLYGMMRKYFDIDMAWILDLWPFALMILGGYLIWEHFKNKQQPSEDALDF